MRILLVSTYELGHQPIGLAAPAAALRARGYDVDCIDLAVEAAKAARFEAADLVAISVPMHTAARLGVEVAKRLRRLKPAAHIAFYGLYASPLHDYLIGSGIADSVIGGEYEVVLVNLAERLTTSPSTLRPRSGESGSGRMDAIAGVGPLPLFERQVYPVPDRRGLPALDQYARLAIGDELRPAGYVEATRGCAHTCTHCPLTPVYGGRLRLVQRETVLADVAQQVELGARHITFGDPDFFNAVPHSLAILEAMHARHPDLTFDATIKVEHLVEHGELLPHMRQLGCLFITSAFESTDDAVLRVLEKGHTRADMVRALALAEAAGIALRPTWMAFTPWTTVAGFLDLLAFVEEQGLVNQVQPVQLGLRLLLPPGSPLIEVIAREGRLGRFEEEALTYTWTNADPRLDVLQAELASIAEEAACCNESNEAAFTKVKQAALRALTGWQGPVSVAQQPSRPAPALTESWFCCAEPTTAQLAPIELG